MNRFIYFYHLLIPKAAANVERAIIKALERQYHDILTPLKDSIPKRLGMQVQKLARRQSTTYYTIPSQVSSTIDAVSFTFYVLIFVSDVAKKLISF